MLKNSSVFMLLFLAIACNFAGNSFAEKNTITVHINEEAGNVNRKIFGSAFLGYDPALHVPDSDHSYDYADYGAGVWNPERSAAVSEVVALAKEVGISSISFPGGCGAHYYKWKETIGKGRKHFLFGIDEFLRTAYEIGADPVITISFFTGNEKDAADLVEYVNAPNDGKHPWAAKRAENGHPGIYGVKNFIFGNEVWHGNHRDRKMHSGKWAVAPEEYAAKYLVYQAAMKKVDSSVRLGLILNPHGDRWNQVVLEKVGGSVDFVDVHIYPPQDLGYYNAYKDFGPDDLFSVAAGSSRMYSETFFELCSRLLEKTSGRNDIFFTISEFNGGFVQDNPIPYRHSLGNALVIAELIEIFMKPSHKIIMANYWHFSNSYWGMIASEDNYVGYNYAKPIRYRKRPNYYVYKLYHDHFGDVLLRTDVRSGTYDMRDFKPYVKKLKKHAEDKWAAYEADSEIPYLSVNASRSINGDKIYLVVVNKNMRSTLESAIELDGFEPDVRGYSWTLNGPSVDSTNEKVESVKIKNREITINGSGFLFRFEPHSVTAIEIPRRKLPIRSHDAVKKH